MAKSRGKLLLKEKALEEIVFGRDVLDHSSATREEVTNAHAIIVQGPGAAWEDDEDTQLEVNLSSTNRLKKLKRDDSVDDGNVSASVFTQLLQERFQTRQLAWAAVETADSADIGEEGDDDLMRRTDSLVETSMSTRQMRKRKTMETTAGTIDDKSLTTLKQSLVFCYCMCMITSTRYVLSNVTLETTLNTSSPPPSPRPRRPSATSSSRRGGDSEGEGADGSPLPEGKINIVRLTDANASEPAVNEPVTALQVTRMDAR